MQTGLSTTATCREFVLREFVFYPVIVDYPYLLASDIAPKSPFRPFNARTDVPDATVGAPPNPGTEAVESALAALDGASYELLRDELDWQTTPGSQDAEEPVRVGAPTTEQDRRCKEYFDDAPGSDPGARAPGAEESAADWDYDIASFEEVVNPLTSSTQTVKLRWGTRAWGYRHIVIRHGWDAGAAERTRLALQTDGSAELDPRDPKRESFRYFYNVPSLPEGMRCRQRVVVSYGTERFVPVGRSRVGANRITRSPS